MGAKRLYTTFWQPSDLKLDASFPLPANISTGTGYLDCINMNLALLRQVLVSASNKVHESAVIEGTFVAGGENGKVNAWARYKPGTTAYDTQLPANCYDNPTFVYNAPTVSSARIGDFAGYNHLEATRPVYWGSPHQSEEYVFYGPLEIKGGLQRGKLGPLLGSGPEDEAFWSRVKVQAWLKVNDGAYSLIETSDYVDLSEPTGEDATVLFTMGDHSETIGNNYTLCLRPVYMDTDDVTPLAVCEGGVEILTYRKWGSAQDIADALSVTLNDVDTQEPVGGNPTTFTYDFDLNNISAGAMSMAVRLRAEDNDAWFNQTYLLTSEVTIPASGSQNFVDSTGVNLPATLYDGTFKLTVEISVDGAVTWIDVDDLGTALQHWQSLP